jgi:hypothetical protein
MMAVYGRNVSYKDIYKTITKVEFETEIHMYKTNKLYSAMEIICNQYLQVWKVDIWNLSILLKTC